MINFFIDLFNSPIFWMFIIGISFVILSIFKEDPPPKKDPLVSINDSIQNLAEKVSDAIDRINK